MTTTKKWLAALAAFALAAALSVCAFVAPAQAALTSNTASVTITGLEKTTGTTPTVYAYKIIEVNWDDTNDQFKTPQYKWNSTIATWLKSNGYSSYVGDGDAVTDYFNTAATGTYNQDNAKALMNALRAEFMKGTSGAFSSLISDTSITTSVTPTGGKATFSSLGLGEYLISVEGATSRVYEVMSAKVTPTKESSSSTTYTATAEPTSISSKGKDVDVDKQVKVGSSDMKTTGVSVGDTVTYEAVVDIPAYPSNATKKTFTFSDTMDTALTLNHNGDTITDLAIYARASSSADWGTALASTATGYPNINSGVSDQSFTLEFNQGDLSGYTQVKIVYTATVNSNITSKIGTGGAGNTASVGFRNNPYTDSDYTTVDDDNPPKVFTYGIILTKTDDTAQKAVLAGASFEVYTDSEMKNKLTFVQTSAGEYRLATSSDSANDKTTTVTVGTGETSGGEKGVLKILGLSGSTNGTSYYFKETKAPDGYVLADETKPVEVKVSTDSEGNMTHLLDRQTQDTSTKGYASSSITNVASNAFTLPTTGDMGTLLLTALGVCAIAAGVYFVGRSRKRG